MKTLFYFVKYAPVGFGVILVIHCGLLLMGYDTAILKELLPFSWLSGVVFTILSYRLKMCVYNRLCIWYDVLMDLCIKAQRYDIFEELGLDVQGCRMFMFVAGGLILVFLITKVYGCKKCRYRSVG